MLDFWGVDEESMSRWQHFVHWLFPPYAKCGHCGDVHLKVRMYKLSLYGYFCNEEEADSHWLNNQI